MSVAMAPFHHCAPMDADSLPVAASGLCPIPQTTKQPYRSPGLARALLALLEGVSLAAVTDGSWG